MTNQELIVIIILSALIVTGTHLIYLCWLFPRMGADADLLISPATLHKLTKMNWVGCIIYWILGLALAPIFTIPGIFAWLFTVGRKD